MTGCGSAWQQNWGTVRQLEHFSCSDAFMADCVCIRNVSVDWMDIMLATWIDLLLLQNICHAQGMGHKSILEVSLFNMLFGCVIGLAELRHKTIRWSVLQTFDLDFHYDYFHWANTGSCKFFFFFSPLDLIARTHPPRIVKLWLGSYQVDYSGVSCIDSFVTLICKIMHKILLCDPWIYRRRITFVFRLKVLMLAFFSPDRLFSVVLQSLHINNLH